jgi:hypothetical protein
MAIERLDGDLHLRHHQSSPPFGEWTLPTPGYQPAEAGHRGTCTRQNRLVEQPLAAPPITMTCIPMLMNAERVGVFCGITVHHRAC